jgi:uncharacterized protein (DUF2147 family)
VRVGYLALIIVALTAPGERDAGDAILGRWLTSEKDARIEIFKSDGKYCGKIAWAKVAVYPKGDSEAGKPKHDRNNPDATKREQPLIGLTLLNNFEYAGENSWTRGSLYNPESGKTYKARLSLSKEGALNVRGYLGVSLLGETTVWTRYNEPNKAGEN